MDETTKAYIAGIIDGEGTISIHRRQNKRVPVLSVTNTDYKIINYLYEVMGTGTISIRKPRKDNHKTGYCIKWIYDNAINLVKEVYPYLIIKKDQADYILQWKDVVKRNGKYNAVELMLREQLVESIQSLNLR
jgi:hypothetical protein